MITGAQLAAALQAMEAEPEFRNSSLLQRRWAQAIGEISVLPETQKIADATLRGCVQLGAVTADRITLLSLLTGLAIGLECGDRVQGAEEMRRLLAR